MLYGTNAVFAQIPFCDNDDTEWNPLDVACAQPLTRTPDTPLSTRWPRGPFFFQPDDFAHGISPNGRPMAEDEAPIEVVLCGTTARRFAGNITPSEKS